MVLTACGSQTSSLPDPLIFSSAALPAAYIGEAYKGTTQVTGGVGPYGYRLVGTLPAGLKFQNGVITGKPTETGKFRFQIEANDARLSNRTKEYTLQVTQLPPLSLGLQLPTTEIRGETRIPVVLQWPRSALTMRLSWSVDPRLKIKEIKPQQGGFVFWKEEDGILKADMAFFKTPTHGTRIAYIVVQPKEKKESVLLKNDFQYEVRGEAGALLISSKLNKVIKESEKNTEKATEKVKEQSSPTADSSTEKATDKGVSNK